MRVRLFRNVHLHERVRVHTPYSVLGCGADDLWPVDDVDRTAPLHLAGRRRPFVDDLGGELRRSTEGINQVGNVIGANHARYLQNCC